MSSSMCDAGASIVHRGSMCARGWTGQDKVESARSQNLASAGLPSVKPTHDLSAVPVQVWFILEREARTSVVFFGGDSCVDSGACRPTPTCSASQCDEQQ